MIFFSFSRYPSGIAVVIGILLSVVIISTFSVVISTFPGVNIVKALDIDIRKRVHKLQILFSDILIDEFKFVELSFVGLVLGFK